MLGGQGFAILAAEDYPNYLSHAHIQPGLTIPPMPGPWGEAVRLQLAKKGWSYTTLKNQTRISKNTITRVVNGRHVKTSVLQKIADALGVPIADVLVWRDLALRNSDASRINSQRSSIERHTGNHEQGASVHDSHETETVEAVTIDALKALVSALQQQVAEYAERLRPRKSQRRRKRAGADRAHKSTGTRHDR